MSTEGQETGQPFDYRTATHEQVADALAQVRLYGEVRTTPAVDNTGTTEISDFRTATDEEFRAELARYGIKPRTC